MTTKEAIREALKHVYDPELGVNIIDLGLVYGIETSDNGYVQIIMTLTTPGCPMGDSIERGVENALFKLSGVKNVSVDLVWEPKWDPSMMSDEAKTYLGFN